MRPITPPTKPKSSDYLLPRKRTQSVPGNGVVQILLSTSISSLLGAILSLNVFSLRVQRDADPPGSLDSVWPAATSLALVTSSVAMMLPALFKDPASKARTLKRYMQINTAGYMTFFLAALGVHFSNAPLIYLGNLGTSVSFGITCTAVIDHLGGYMPASFGLAVAVFNVAMGAGNLFSAWAYHAMLQVMSAGQALSIVALVATATCFIGSLFMEPAMPDPELNILIYDAETGLIGGNYPQVHTKAPNQSGYAVLKSVNFWIFVLIVTLERVALPLLPFFFDIGHLYGIPTDSLIRYYQISTVISTVISVIVSGLTDVLRTSFGPLHSGGRNIAVIVMALQTACFLLLLETGSKSSHALWVVCVLIIQNTFLTQFSLASVLGRDMFGQENIALVIGIGVGLAFFIGGGAFSAIISNIDSVPDSVRSPSTFLEYYRLGCLASATALVLIFMLRKNVQAS